MRFSHMIFDLDGTLMDTEQAVLKTWQFTLREYGYEYFLEELRVVLGVTTETALDKLGVEVDERFENAFHKLDIEADKSFEKRWMENYRNFCGEVDFFEGTKEMLAALKKKGCSLGIVTSRLRQEYDDYFSVFHLETFFDRIVCADDTVKHKPDPEPLQHYVSLADAERSSCIYIGDMPTDILCASRAGMTSGLAVWNWSHVVCAAADADFIFTSPEEVLGL